jgi:putative DNA primase/helicase
MIARDVAIALDGKRCGREWRCLCPVHCAHSLIVADGRDGRLLVKCFGGCEWHEIFAELRARQLIAGGDTLSPEQEEDRRRREEARTRTEVERIRHRIAAARDLYRRGADPHATIVETYLRSRGIIGPIPAALRYLRFCPHRNGHYCPAMVAPIVNADGEQIAAHKTFLKPDGSGKAGLPKEEQRETCGPMKGGSIRLAPHQPDVELLIGEGIESTASAMQLFALPGWAAICAGGIEALELPPEVKAVTIAADNDVGGTGQRAALSARERWEAEGRSVRILLPPNPGDDFNDVLRSEE